MDCGKISLKNAGEFSALLLRRGLRIVPLLCVVCWFGKADGTSISGTVRSDDGTRLPGALLLLTGSEGGAYGQTVSGERGAFRFSRVPAGNYEIRVELSGFEPQTFSNIELALSESVTIDLTLTLTLAGEEMITIIGDSPRDSLETTVVRESPAKDVGEALAMTPGVWRIRRGGIANDLFLRGFQGRALNVLIDGTRVYGACPNNMDPSSFHIDFAEVDRIDIGKGPFDMRNSGGLGGTVNIVTKKAGIGWALRPSISLGSFGFFNPAVTGSYGNESFSLLGGFSYRHSGIYRDGSGRKFTELANYLPSASDNEAFRVGTAWGQLGWSLSPAHRIQVTYARQEADDVYYPYLKMDAVFDNTDRFSLRYEADNIASSGTRLSILTFYSEVAHWMTDEFRTSSSMGSRDYAMGTMARASVLGGTLQAERSHVLLGVNFTRRFWGAATELAPMGYQPQFSIPDVDMDTVGLFIEYKGRLTEGLAFTTGGRLDWSTSQADREKADSDLYYAYHGTRATAADDLLPGAMGQLSYAPNSMIEVGVGLGSTMMAAEPTDRFFALKRMGSDWVGNPTLKASRNTSIDASIALDYSRIFLGGNLFVSWIPDFVTVYDQPRLQPRTDAISSQARTYSNVDARLWGSEANVVFLLTDLVQLTGSLSYVRGTQDAVASEGGESVNMAEIPPLRSQISLRYDNGRFFGSMESLLSTPQSHVNIELNEEETPGFATFGLRGGIRQKHILLTVGVENILNRTYSEHLSYQRDPFRSGVRVTEPGRSFFLNCQLRF